jgi:hypothetical protein
MSADPPRPCAGFRPTLHTGRRTHRRRPSPRPRTLPPRVPGTAVLRLSRPRQAVCSHTSLSRSPCWRSGPAPGSVSSPTATATGTPTARRLTRRTVSARSFFRVRSVARCPFRSAFPRSRGAAGSTSIHSTPQTKTPWHGWKPSSGRSTRTAGCASPQPSAWPARTHRHWLPAIDRDRRGRCRDSSVQRNVGRVSQRRTRIPAEAGPRVVGGARDGAARPLDQQRSPERAGVRIRNSPVRASPGAAVRPRARRPMRRLGAWSWPIPAVVLNAPQRAVTRIDRGMRVCRPRPKSARTIVPISEPLPANTRVRSRVDARSSRWTRPVKFPGCGGDNRDGWHRERVADVYLDRPSPKEPRWQGGSRTA